MVKWNTMKAAKKALECLALVAKKKSPNIPEIGSIKAPVISTVDTTQAHSLQPCRDKHLDVIHVIIATQSGMKQKAFDI